MFIILFEIQVFTLKYLNTAPEKNGINKTYIINKKGCQIFSF